MKRIALTLGVTGVVIIIGLVFTNRALAEQPCAPIPQDDPPYSLDGAWVSGIEGSLGTDAEGTLSIVPSGFPPSRMTEGDIEGMTGWELAAGHIGVPGIDNGTVLALVVDGAGRTVAWCAAAPHGGARRIPGR